MKKHKHAILICSGVVAIAIVAYLYYKNTLKTTAGMQSQALNSNDIAAIGATTGVAPSQDYVTNLGKDNVVAFIIANSGDKTFTSDNLSVLSNSQLNSMYQSAYDGD